MKIFLNTGFFIFIINGFLNPIFSFQNTNNSIDIKEQNSSTNFYKDFFIVTKNHPNKQTFTLKDIPDYSIEKLKNSIKQNKDPFVDSVSVESSSFEDLYIILVGLFKINDEKTAMFLSKDGIKNYIIGDKIKGNYLIKDIDLLTKEVLITDGKEQKSYRFPE